MPQLNPLHMTLRQIKCELKRGFGIEARSGADKEQLVKLHCKKTHDASLLLFDRSKCLTETTLCFSLQACQLASARDKLEANKSTNQEPFLKGQELDEMAQEEKFDDTQKSDDGQSQVEVDSEEAEPAPQISEYERLRQEQIKKNAAFMVSCGLTSAVDNLQTVTAGIEVPTEKRGKVADEDFGSLDMEDDSEDSDYDRKLQRELVSEDSDDDFQEEDSGEEGIDLVASGLISPQDDILGTMWKKESVGRGGNRSTKKQSKKWKRDAGPVPPPKVVEMSIGRKKKRTDFPVEESFVMAEVKMQIPDTRAKKRAKPAVVYNSKIEWNEIAPKKYDCLASHAPTAAKPKAQKLKEEFDVLDLLEDLGDDATMRSPILCSDDHDEIEAVQQQSTTSQQHLQVHTKKQSPVSPAAKSVTIEPSQSPSLVFGGTCTDMKHVSPVEEAVIATKGTIVRSRSLILTARACTSNEKILRPEEIQLSDKMQAIKVGRAVDKVGATGILLDSSDKIISRLHAELSRNPASGVWSLIDLNSSNGVFANGTRLKKKPLREGDHISFGAPCPCAECKVKAQKGNPPQTARNTPKPAPFVYIVQPA